VISNAHAIAAAFTARAIIDRFSAAAGDQTTGKFGDRGRYVTGDGGQQFFLTNSGEIGRTGKKITGPPSPVKSTPSPAGPAGKDEKTKEKPVQSTGEVKEPTPGSKSHPLHYSNLPEAIRRPLIAWTNDAEAIVQPIAQAMHGASLAHESRQSEGRLRAAKSGQEFEPSPDDTLADSIRKAAARQWGGYVQSGGVDPKLVALGVRQTSQAVPGVDPKQVANHLGKLTAIIQEARQQGVDIRPFILHNNMIPRILAAKLKPNPKLFEPVKPEERFSARFAEMYEATEGGRWITIGSNKEAPKGEKGGTPVFVKGDGEIAKGPPSLKGQKIGSIRPQKENKRPSFTKKEEESRSELYKKYKQESESEDSQIKENAWNKYLEERKRRFGAKEEIQKEWDIQKSRNDVLSVIKNLDELNKKRPEEISSLQYMVREKANKIKFFEKDYKRFYEISNQYAQAISEKRWGDVNSIAKKIENMHGFKSMFSRVKKASEFTNLSNLAETLSRIGKFPSDLAEMRWDYKLQDEHRDLVKKASELSPDSIGDEALDDYMYSDWLPQSLRVRADRNFSVKNWEKENKSEATRRSARKGRKISQTANAAIEHYRKSLIEMRLPATKELFDKKISMEKEIDSFYDPWAVASRSGNKLEMDRISAEIKARSDSVYQIKESIRKESFSALIKEIGESGEIKIETEGVESLPENQKADVSEAINWLSSIISPSLSIGKIKFKAMDPNHPNYDGRSHCSGDTVFLAPHAGTSVIIHEIGHAIEHSNEGKIGGTSKAFLHSQTFEQPVKHLGNGYSTHEVATKNGFENAYTGKYYPGNDSTEILSMGLQSLYENAYYFAKFNKNHFNYTIAAVKGMV
jgi:hypothetical protein